jgi:hypothetical protein
MRRMVILTLFSATFLISCQKDGDQPEPQNPPGGGTVLLKSVIYLDTTSQTGLDTIFKNEYWYDSDGRLTKRYNAEYQYGTTVYVYVVTDSLIYSGSARTPIKFVETQTSFTPLHYFMTYDNSNNIIKDSTFEIGSPNRVFLNSYTNLSAGRYLRLYNERNLSTGVVTHIDSAVYRREVLNGNILSAADSSHSPVSGLRTTNLAYTYDDKTNPFASIAVFPILGNYQFSGDGVLPIGKNNALSLNETYFDGAFSYIVYSATVAYTYRADGLPLIGRISNYLDANKVLFTYY